MRLLKDIIYGVRIEEVKGNTNIAVESISFDSREINNLSLFVAVKGVNQNGHNFISTAEERGACAIICEDLPQSLKENITYIKVSDSSESLGIVASNFFDNPSEKLKLVGITGTNGKSTTCSIIHHVFNKNNIKAKLAGNIGAPILEMKFKKQVIYIIEASSFQLEYSKFVKPYCAAILNITDDHLDWHGTKNKYIKSKFKIFKNQTKEDIALINDLNFK